MRQRIKAHNERPEVKAAEALTREIAMRGPLTLVLVERSLANDVLAEVYLNAPPPLARYFVAAEPGFDDEVIDRATGLALQYELRHPTDVGAVKFTLFRNGSYVCESATNGRTEDRQFFDGFYNDRTLRTRELKLAAETKDVTHVGGVGLAKVLSLNYPH